MTYDEETALHEAGHAVVADRLGRKITLVTVEPGEHQGGACRYLPPLVRFELPRTVESPLVTWSAALQRELASDVVIAMAGDFAVELFARRGTTPRRLPPSVTEQAAARLEALAADEPAAATPAELAEADGAVNSPLPSDDERIAEAAFAAHGRDLVRAAGWLHWLGAETRALLLADEQAVRRMAALLMKRGTIGEQAAAACLREERA